MMFCKELNKSFDDEETMFSELKLNKEDILALKKAKIQKSCDKGIGIITKSLDLLKLTEEFKNLSIDDNHYYIAVNATKILDSHNDVHIDGLWKKTIKDQQGKNYLVADHKLELDKVIAKKGDIQMMTADIPFSFVGKNYEGNTQALIYKVPKDKIIMPQAKEWLDSGEIEASVRMRYISVKLAMNSKKPEDAEEFKNYNDYIDQIANKSDFESIPYFFPILEAENTKESSLVLFGSNSATGVIDNNNKQKPMDFTSAKNEPIDQITQKRKRSVI
jgi:hypothetical protein